jgi:drug/metabolite transporter (DMT)-like permease
MSLTVFAVVLFAATLHAAWNAIVKSGPDKLLSTTLVAGASALLAAVALPFLPPPDRASWGFIAGSSLVQVAYYVLVANAYRVADMGQTYPLMRGTAPLIVALAGASVLGEPLRPFAWLGVGVICAGVLVMAVGRHGGQSRQGVVLALANAVVIASYTLIDGVGVRRSGSPAAYSLWLFLLTGAALVAWVAATRRRALLDYAARHWRGGLVGGAGTTASYGLALWAMTLAPVAMVAALRETSILFGAAIAGLVLRERLGWRRITAAGVIVVGAALLRLA